MEMLRVARGIGKFRAVAKVDGEIAAEAGSDVRAGR